LHYLLLV